MSGPKNKRGSTLAAAAVATFFVGGVWVLLMSAVAGTERAVQLPDQLKKHHTQRPLVTISENGGDTRSMPTAQQDALAPISDEPASLLWPVRGTHLSSTFGFRINPITGEGQVHRGVDVPVPCGSEVVAVEEGTVTFAEWTAGGGNTVGIAHDGGWVTRYAHLARLAVRPGQHVSAGQLLGDSGDTGAFSTGPHLHFEIWSGHTAVDPMAFNYRQQSGVAHPATAVACGKQAATAMGSADAF
jgi:murein DD-endopeptidase MepM/ murein hydrolase activator NlpD